MNKDVVKINVLVKKSKEKLLFLNTEINMT